jgi:hypothetical protein
MDAIQTVRAEFSGFAFGEPATQGDIERAERELGESLPAVLRDFYRAFDGFRGPTEARFLWPLFAKSGLVDFNRFLREGNEFPHAFVSSCIFFGDAGIGDMWGIKRDLPGTVIRWDASWGEEYEVAGNSPLETWLAEKKFYEGLPEKA